MHIIIHNKSRPRLGTFCPPRVHVGGYDGNHVHPRVRGVPVPSKLRRLCQKSQEVQPGGESNPPVKEDAHERRCSEEELRPQSVELPPCRMVLQTSSVSLLPSPKGNSGQTYRLGYYRDRRHESVVVVFFVCRIYHRRCWLWFFLFLCAADARRFSSYCQALTVMVVY